METRYLRSFLKIADVGSISRAAESLGISQPSLSQQLLRLEDEMGTPLFRRTARGVTLTEAGRVFQTHAQGLLLAAEQAVEDMRQFRGQASGQVILALPYSVSRLAGLALVDSLRAEAPQVAVRLVEASTGQIRGWLEEGKVDLGVLVDFGPLSRLSLRPLAREELFLIGPAGRWGTADMPGTVAPAALAELPLVLPGPPHGLRLAIEHEAARLGAVLEVTLEIDALAHVGPLVARGELHAIMPLPAVAAELAGGNVSVARIGTGMARRLALARNPARLVTHASVRCEDIALACFARLIADGAWRAESLVDQS